MNQLALLDEASGRCLAPLPPGTEAWALVFDVEGAASQSGERRRLLGAARVLVLERVGDSYRARVLRASGDVLVGAVFELRRADLWRCADRDEHQAFAAEVRRLWPSL